MRFGFIALEAASLAMNFLFARCWWVRDAALLQSLISSALWKQCINCPCSVGVRCCSAFLRPARVKTGWMISVYKPGSGCSQNAHNPPAGACMTHPVCTSALNISSQKTPKSSVLWLSCSSSSSSSCWTGLVWAVFITQQVFQVGSVWRWMRRQISLSGDICMCLGQEPHPLPVNVH